MKMLPLLLFLFTTLHHGHTLAFHLPPLLRLNERMKILSQELSKNMSQESRAQANQELMEIKYMLLSAMYKFKMATLEQLKTISKFSLIYRGVRNSSLIPTVKQFMAKSLVVHNPEIIPWIFMLWGLY